MFFSATSFWLIKYVQDIYSCRKQMDAIYE